MTPVKPKPPAPPVIVSGIATCISTDMRPADDWPGCKD
jgi:hypothetical protein